MLHSGSKREKHSQINKSKPSTSGIIDKLVCQLSLYLKCTFVLKAQPDEYRLDQLPVRH